MSGALGPVPGTWQVFAASALIWAWKPLHGLPWGASALTLLPQPSPWEGSLHGLLEQRAEGRPWGLIQETEDPRISGVEKSGM